MAWENPKFKDAMIVPVPGNFETYPEVPADEVDTQPEIESIKTPEQLMAEVLALTRARNAAREERAEQERLAAIGEIHDTVGALVDLLAELDYPGAEIVNGLRGGVKPGGSKKGDLRDIPLWLLDVPDVWGLGQKRYAFGADRRIYSIWVKDLGENENKKTYSYLYYHPLDVMSMRAKSAYLVRDALGRFEIPTEDDLLQ